MKVAVSARLARDEGLAVTVEVADDELDAAGPGPQAAASTAMTAMVANRVVLFTHVPPL